mmetsp:Transcript_136059/g.322447  ORF Transcript_136059/g.322447 Transcript_136059/m.322447 type:complete len:162 (-) Transcript_136059:1105-1590(-)
MSRDAADSSRILLEFSSAAQRYAVSQPHGNDSDIVAAVIGFRKPLRSRIGHQLHCSIGKIFAPNLKHGAYSVRIAQEFPNSIGATKQQIFLLELKQLETWLVNHSHRMSRQVPDGAGHCQAWNLLVLGKYSVWHITRQQQHFATTLDNAGFLLWIVGLMVF